jgi:hypothetical protein
LAGYGHPVADKKVEMIVQNAAAFTDRLGFGAGDGLGAGLALLR